MVAIDKTKELNPLRSRFDDEKSQRDLFYTVPIFSKVKCSFKHYVDFFFTIEN